jgi:hypothetical protein
MRELVTREIMVILLMVVALMNVSNEALKKFLVTLSL